MAVAVGTKFQALQNFESAELQSAYCEEFKYQVREGNDVLAALVPQWVEEGKVKILDETAAAGAQVTGKG